MKKKLMNYVPVIFLRNKAKKAILTGIDFVQSFCVIEEKDILAKLESIPFV